MKIYLFSSAKVILFFELTKFFAQKMDFSLFFMQKGLPDGQPSCL